MAAGSIVETTVAIAAIAVNRLSCLILTEGRRAAT
jgi:hypothetical protein